MAYQTLFGFLVSKKSLQNQLQLEAKRTILSSIFPGKLTFEDGKYLTDGLNPALASILQKSNGL
jgi:hypothetical protein